MNCNENNYKKAIDALIKDTPEQVGLSETKAIVLSILAGGSNCYCDGCGEYAKKYWDNELNSEIFKARQKQQKG